MLTLNAYLLDKWQGCKRDYRIGLTHRFNKWTIHGLLSACLRKSILAMCDGQDAETVADLTVQYFLACARNPGLELPHGLNNYTLVMDYCSIIRNVLEYMSRCPLLQLKPLKPVQLSPDVQWEFLSLADQSGVLHRWDFIDYIPDDPLGILHGWDVFGDMAASGLPMTLHMVGIGKRDGSHQNSPWCKVYSHPRVHNQYRFNRKSGGALEGDWQTVYFAEGTKNKAGDWVDWMERDNTIDSLMKSVRVSDLSQTHRHQFNYEALEEAAEMQRYSTAVPRSVPMSRKRCDNPTICRHQDFCYGLLELDDMPAYSRVTKKKEPEVQSVGV
jgi:hypothetical protein